MRPLSASVTCLLAPFVQRKNADPCLSKNRNVETNISRHMRKNQCIFQYCEQAELRNITTQVFSTTIMGDLNFLSLGFHGLG
jgi:hypothetical protein